jgi:two-component system, OmpR family, response regulator
MRILIAEDEDQISETLKEALSYQQHVVDVASDGQTAWELVEAFTYDLILLDVVLPKLDGITFCQKLRQHGYHMPVLMLTAKGTLDDKILGLDSGADDYLLKPFELKELEARIRALMRRSSDTLPPILRWGKLQLNPNTCEVMYENTPVHLTPKEYSLLSLFLRNSNRMFSRSAIIEQLWSFEEPPGEETVKMHIKSLRHKLKLAGATEDPIETVYGLGYRLRHRKVRDDRP